MSHSITGKTKILGVIGYPVTYSLSPVMHNRALAHLGLDYVYVALPVPIDRFSVAIQGLFACESVMGFNLTIPHKQEILPHLVEISPIAQTVGAVNTVKRSAEGWIGTNTDVEGFIYPLHNRRLTKAVILGTGGAAKAVIVGCQKLGIKNITVVGRSEDKLQLLQQQFAVNICPWLELSQVIENSDLVVNCTPIGMDNHSPLTDTQIAALAAQTIVYDLIYTPRPTPLLQLAQARGLTTIDGLEMLLYQGALALTYWLEVSPPIAVMAEALGIPYKS
ncbi:MAG: shikimate dehydrogenase [Pseudanabaenaceae cyanobacterium SKYGB_i_bin29]|nr:shikimate dehydrogenase [Pseudanabaenaceae cyanobacterium SKYG29]MDW8421918.1 shikimate dehydrogenase [Pseudanabaenaceae cyanobacterium SKYGB_i_bin29]